MDFDALLSASAFAVSVGGLVPIFIIKEDRRKELAIVIVVSLLIALTAVMAVRNREHASEVREIQKEIVGTLSGNRWTSDQIYKQLHFPRRDVFFEALSGVVDQGRVEQAVVEVRIDDSLPVDVRLYWVQSARTQARESVSPAACGSPETGCGPAQVWRVGVPHAPWPLFSALTIATFALCRNKSFLTASITARRD
jgi:hypothetical protein